jgi:hypothetical protein
LGRRRTNIFYGFSRDSMVREAEETIGLGSMDQFFRYLIDAGFEIVERDAGDGAVGVF